MRRRTRFALATLVVLLVLVGGYVAFWWIVAGKIQNGLDDWRQSASKQKIDASWQRLRVSGFPFAFRIEVDDASFRDHTWNPAPEMRLAHLIGTAKPWDFDDWHLTAPAGFETDLAPSGGRPAVKLVAASAEGTASIGPRGGSWLWLRAHDIAAEAARRVPIKSAEAWIFLPAKPPAKDIDPSFGLAVDLRHAELPAAPENFAKTIDELAFGVTVKGVLVPGPLAQAAAAWRDAGGTIEVDNLRVEWSGLGITANGTLALDRMLQPMAALSGGIEGFGAILDALVAADRLTPEQASMLNIALNTLAKPGSDGKPQIAVPFTIQNGKMFLGPARLGAAPRIIWE